MRAIHAFTLLVLCALLSGASADDGASQAWSSIKLIHTKPSELLARAGFTLRSDDGKSRTPGEPSRYIPPESASAVIRGGISYIVAFDLDNCFIVKGSEQAVEELRSLVKTWDIAPKQVWLYPSFVQIESDKLTRLASAAGLKRVDPKLSVAFLSEKDLAKPVWDDYRQAINGRGKEWSAPDSTVDFSGRQSGTSERYHVASQANADGSVTITVSKVTTSHARDGACTPMVWTVLYTTTTRPNDVVAIAVDDHEPGHGLLIAMQPTVIDDTSSLPKHKTVN